MDGGDSTPIPPQTGFGRADLPLLPDKSRWCSNSPIRWNQQIEQGANFRPPLRGNKTVGTGAPLSLGSHQWSKWRTELQPHSFATRQCESVLHFAKVVLAGPRENLNTHPTAHVLNLNSGLPTKKTED